MLTRQQDLYVRLAQFDSLTCPPSDDSLDPGRRASRSGLARDPRTGRLSRRAGGLRREHRPGGKGRGVWRATQEGPYSGDELRRCTSHCSVRARLSSILTDNAPGQRRNTRCISWRPTTSCCTTRSARCTPSGSGLSCRARRSRGGKRRPLEVIWKALACRSAVSRSVVALMSDG